MNSSIKTLLGIAILFLISGYSDDTSTPPDFKQDLFIKNFIGTYKCERVEFENWEDDDATDSSLTICLINSKLADPKFNSIEKLPARQIASQVKKALVNPENYKSYTVHYIKRTGVSVFRGNVNTYQVEFQSTHL
ncbi:hypothetical protein [Daejeonella oryzae]|uniref:hypothetical protein n=1 Tax=Daejeonella oryzae TaxID=1122943 RepID=UPI000419C67B|nr:hypothetical protein [Daejeonella oryzae]